MIKNLLSLINNLTFKTIKIRTCELNPNIFESVVGNWNWIPSMLTLRTYMWGLNWNRRIVKKK